MGLKRFKIGTDDHQIFFFLLISGGHIKTSAGFAEPFFENRKKCHPKPVKPWEVLAPWEVSVDTGIVRGRHELSNTAMEIIGSSVDGRWHQ